MPQKTASDNPEEELWRSMVFSTVLCLIRTKIRLVKAMVFPVVMYGCESWTIKKAERQRMDALELWCWNSPMDCKVIKPVNPKGNQL